MGDLQYYLNHCAAQTSLLAAVIDHSLPPANLTEVMLNMTIARL